MVRTIMVPRRVGKGGAYMRIRVLSARRPLQRTIRRLHASGATKHDISRRLDVPRRAVERALNREIWRG